MNIAEGLFVAIDYRLSLESGEEVDSSPEGKPLGFVAGGGQIIPGLEKALMGMKTGDSKKVSLDPEEAYGPFNDDLLQNIPRNKFPADAEIKTGMAFQAQGPRGPVMLTVTKINDDDTITVDLNHPMAGKRLFFDVSVVEVREPKDEEMPGMAGGCACGSQEKEDCGPGCECG